MNNNERESTIDLKRILFILLGKKWIILAVSVVFAIAIGLYTEICIDEQFTSVATMFVQNKDVDGENSSSTISSSDMIASSSLAKVCQDIFTSDRMLVKVEKSLTELGYSVDKKQLKNMITITSTNENQVMNVKVVSAEPMLSQEIASLVAENANDVYKDIVKIGSVEIISDATYSEIPSSPNLKRNIALGFIIGFVLMCAAIIIADLLDTKIKPQDNLIEIYGIPLFAEIMDFDLELKGGNGYEYSSKK